MLYVEPDAIIKAKQIDLLSYMKSCEPDNLVHIKGDNYCTKEHDSLKNIQWKMVLVVAWHWR